LARLAAYGGAAGPVLFTAAWVVSSLRQAGHPAAGVQLSGLAAGDARDPQLMMTAFVVLGGCSIGLGAALSRVAVPRSAGPWLVMAAGAATAAAGVFRRDHILLTGPVSPVSRGTTRCMTWSAPSLTRRCSRRRWSWAGAFALTRTGPFSPARFRFLPWPARWPWQSSPSGRLNRGTALCSGSRSRLLLPPRFSWPPGC
jgi:hypothetical protein